jgi:hypothetical protein
MRGFNIGGLHLKMNQIITKFVRLPISTNQHHWLTTAIHGTDRLEVVMFCCAETMTVALESIFTPCDSTTWLSNCHTISHNDFCAVKHSIWHLQYLHASEASVRELLLTLEDDTSIARIHGLCKAIFLVAVMWHYQAFSS